MTSKSMTILAVDDDPGDAELLHRHLDNIAGFNIGFIYAASSSEAKHVLSERAVDMIFLDQLLGADTGLDFLEQLRGSGDLRPIVAMTGQGCEYLARDLMRKGADDYLVKHDVCSETLRRSMAIATSRAEQRRLETLNKELAQDLKSKNEALEQKNLRLAELYETAYEFVDNVSHEFRTPLTVIKEFTSIMNDGLVGEVSPEQKEYLGTVLDRVDDLATMIDDMLDISKLEAGMLGAVRKVCSFKEIADRVQKTLERRAKSNKIELSLPETESLPMLYCDPEKVGRVIINLAINAIKFSDEGGEVSVWAKHEPGQGVVMIGITDHGPGIDPDKLAEIFDRFQQVGGDIRSSTRGFGLGLNIARELVHLNLGDIEVASEVGEGSTFSFTVPTTDHAKLIVRYLDRVESFRTGSSYVSLILASTEDLLEETSRRDMEYFVQHQIRKSDLLLPASSGGWIIVAASNQRELSSLIQRIERAHLDANRNRPCAPLPVIALAVKGTWPLPGGRDEFIQAYMGELVKTESQYA